ncbi:MAG: response regulator [Thermoplasmata archaeon]|nr:response regulator [Thermoplasmata archaeon]
MATIFTVDDEKAIIEVYRDILEIKDHNIVAEAFNGEEAINVFKKMEIKPDIVIMDHRMPIKSGIEAMKEIHAMDPMQCVIFVTADYQAAKDAILMGANSFVLKPFMMDNLFNAIGTALYELEERKTRIRETLLGIVTQYRSSGEKGLKRICDLIEHDVIDVYLRNLNVDDITPTISSAWTCGFMNLTGFDFHYELLDNGKVQITNKKCYWMEKFGAEPIFCSVTRCILTRFAMKTDRDVSLDTLKTLMNKDDCCLFEISL